MNRRDFIGAKVEKFSKDLPHDVFIPENHLQALSLEIFLHLIFRQFRSSQNKIAAPSAQRFQNAQGPQP